MTVIIKCPVFESTGSGAQTYTKAVDECPHSSKLSTVQVHVLVGLGNLSALRNVKLSVNQGVIYAGLYRQAFGTMHVSQDNREVHCTKSLGTRLVLF